MPWTYMNKETEPDKKHRVSLGPSIKTPDGVRYRVMQNETGQILLDPVVSVPAYEAWFFNDPERVAAFQRSVAQAEAGEFVTIDLGQDDDEDE